MLGGETTEDGVLQFPLFQRLLTDRCNTTIYLGSAVTQFAMAGTGDPASRWDLPV